MAALTLHRRPSSSYSSQFPSRYYNPLHQKSHLSISPKPLLNPTKTSILFTISFPLLNNPLQIRRRIFASAIQNPDSDRGKRLDEAREALREYLEEIGASNEDASRISRNCPNYLNVLVDGVDDLDDWNSWTGGAAGEIEVDFRKKVRQMAEQKGDNGVLPFLESLGLSLPSATHLARYLSSSDCNTLPLLVHKVEYIRNVLYSDNDGHELIGKNAVRMIANLSISADDEDLQQTLAFFQKIQARRGGLSLLGSEQTSFRHLIESFPRLLFLPLQSHVQPIVEFLEDIGVPKGRIRNVLLLFPPVLFYRIDKDIKPRLESFKKIGMSDDDLAKMLVKYPWILSASILANFEEVIDFFDEVKVPRHYSSHAIKNWPHILGCSVNKLTVMVAQLSEMGIVNKKLGHVIATSPQLLLRKPQEFVQVVFFFQDLGLDDEEIAKTVVRCPEIFAANVAKTLQKKLEFLCNVGISKSHLPGVIRKYPELFVCDVDKALLPRIRFLANAGLSKKDIRHMVSRFSPLLGYSIEEVLRPKLIFLVDTMGKPLSTVVEYPRYFSYSLEKRIKPRYQVLKDRNIELSLKEMLSKNNDEFAALYLRVEEPSIPAS